MKKNLLLLLIFIGVKFSAQCPPQLGYYTSTGTQTLTCFDPTIVATGTTNTSNTQITWIIPGTQSVVNSPTITFGPPNGPATSTTALAYASYTVVATNTAAACSTQSVVTVNQNFRAPNPMLAVGNPSVIDCSGNSVVLNYTNGGVTSGIPGAIAIVQSWAGPVSQATSAAISYSAYTSGVYTLTVQDNKNGCYGYVTKYIPSNNQPPTVQTSNQTFTMNCGTQVAIPITVTSYTQNITYLYYNYPYGASFSPLNSIQPPSGTTSSVVTVNYPGLYQCIVKDNYTQCTTTVNTTIVLNDVLSQVTLMPTPPSCSTCCDGSVAFSVPASLANNFSVSVSSGTINGNPPTSVSNLCYGMWNYTLYNTQNNCMLPGSLNINGTVGIKENLKDNEIVIYPNPSNGLLYLTAHDNETFSAKIISMDGREIIFTEVKDQMDLSGLPEGVYTIELKAKNQLARKKLIITK